MRKLLRDTALVILITISLLFIIDLCLVFYFKPNGHFVAKSYCEPELEQDSFCDFRPLFLAHYPSLYIAITHWAKGRTFDPINIDQIDKSKARFKKDRFLRMFYRRDHATAPYFDPNNKVRYFYSKEGHRIPSKDYEPKKENKLFFTFFGGSFAHGDHLNYEETLPHFTNQIFEEFNVYNLGLSGRGLKEALLLTMYPDFFDSIKEDKGIFIYVYTEMHDERLYPTIHLSPQYIEHFLELSQDGDLLYGGYYFEALRGLPSALNFIKFSGFGRLLRLHKKTWPIKDTDSTMCKLVNLFKKRLESVKPQSRFIVANYADVKNHFVQCLEQSNIPYISPFAEDPDKLTRLPDSHPNANANQFFAKELAPILKNEISLLESD